MTRERDRRTEDMSAQHGPIPGGSIQLRSSPSGPVEERSVPDDLAQPRRLRVFLGACAEAGATWRRQGWEAFVGWWRPGGRGERPACRGTQCGFHIWNAHAWSRRFGWRDRVLLEGEAYCPACLPQALSRRFATCLPAAAAPRPAHRIPLGLMLLSRGWITPEQLTAGLERQQVHGGRLGESLRWLGHAHEHEITAGLAAQWACPVLFLRSTPSEAHLQRVPLRLQEQHAMVPVHYSAAANVLILAFANGVDYAVTQALAGMLGCRIEPCVAPASEVQRSLGLRQGLARGSEITFERIGEAGERSTITLSYVQRWDARRVRATACGTSVWARLEKPGETLDLLFLGSEPATSAA